MSSDISIDQFRFLERLLLVHGHLCYRRISSMICYFFYKNIAFGLTLFLYDAYTSFSEQAAYNDWINTFFNVFFMSLPVIALGVFDQDVSACFCLKLAGFKMEVVKTTSAGYAKKLASTVDFSTCPDGIICVGGDGIVNEVGRVRAVVSEGVKEIWLSNEDTGAYGRDIGTSLPHLLNAIVAELPPDRSTMLRIGMTNPPYIVEHLEEIAKALCHPSVYSFLHVPVQSGSDSVLQGKVQGEKNQWRVS